MALHHEADNGFTIAPSEIEREFSSTIYVSPVLADFPKIFFIPSLGRSPPV
jgi:hypothetical protein